METEKNIENEHQSISIKEIEDYMNFDMKDTKKKIEKFVSLNGTFSLSIISLIMTPIAGIYGANQYDNITIVNFMMVVLYAIAPIFFATLTIIIANKLQHKSTTKKNKEISLELYSLLDKKEFSNFINVILKQDSRKDNQGNFIKLTEKQKIYKIKSVNKFLENIRAKNVTFDDLDFFNTQDKLIQEQFNSLFYKEPTSKERTEALINLNNIDKILNQNSGKDREKMIEESFNFANR